jgi:hypothetical protein
MVLHLTYPESGFGQVWFGSFSHECQGLWLPKLQARAAARRGARLTRELVLVTAPRTVMNSNRRLTLFYFRILGGFLKTRYHVWGEDNSNMSYMTTIPSQHRVNIQIPRPQTYICGLASC